MYKAHLPIGRRGSSLNQERVRIREEGRLLNHVFIGHHITQSICWATASLQHYCTWVITWAEGHHLMGNYQCRKHFLEKIACRPNEPSMIFHLKRGSCVISLKGVLFVISFHWLSENIDHFGHSASYHTNAYIQHCQLVAWRLNIMDMDNE